LRARIPLLALVLGACCIGLAPIFPKWAFDLERASGVAQPLGIIAAAFWRMAFATPVLLLWRLRRVPEKPLAGSDRWLLVLPGLAFAADMAAWHKSFEYTSLANSTLLANFATIVVSLAGWIALGERITGQLIAGALLALVGAAVLLGVDFSVGSDPLLGDALALLAACFYASYLLAIKRLRARFSTARIMAYNTAVSALGLLLIAFVLGEGLWPHDSRVWWLLVALALVAQVGGQGLITYSMAHLPASFASVALLVQPVVTAAISWVLFDQALSPLQLAGALLVLAGVTLAGRARGSA
jgi:drug/metabolite transporter (DMT)-like permease